MRLLISLACLGCAEAYSGTMGAPNKLTNRHTIKFDSPIPKQAVASGLVGQSSSPASKLGSIYFGSPIGSSAGNAMYLQKFTETKQDQSIGFVYGCVNHNKLAAKVTFVNKRKLKEVKARQLNSVYWFTNITKHRRLNSATSHNRVQYLLQRILVFHSVFLGSGFFWVRLAAPMYHTRTNVSYMYHLFKQSECDLPRQCIIPVPSFQTTLNLQPQPVSKYQNLSKDSSP